MMEYVEINHTKYGFIKDFKDDQDLRTSFNQLTQTVFGFNLEDWYQNGYWGDYYIPYSLIHQDRVVSNISINQMEFKIEGERKVGIQLGTVMTEERYRHQGLNQFIMERVMNEWKGSADFIYLFANDTVLDFYPRFNFQVVKEYQHTKKIHTHDRNSSWKKLNMEDQGEVSFLLEMINHSIPTSSISMRGNASLMMFYCNSYKKESVFYIKALEAVVIADFDQDTLYLHEIFSAELLQINDLIKTIPDKSIQQIVLGFTPLEDEGFERQLLEGPDTLFILKDQLGFFTDRQWMFPILSHT